MLIVYLPNLTPINFPVISYHLLILILAEGRITEALIESFLALDEKMRENNELKEEMSGSKS
jgi:hypothetical protein